MNPGEKRASFFRIRKHPTGPTAKPAMDHKDEVKYKLAPGTQVREEEFGLLFYTMNGPRLYFLASGKILGDRYFLGEKTLKDWLENHAGVGPLAQHRLAVLTEAMDRLAKKGVILAC
jgi:putative mycofactocin binding protein MftB